jgi:chemotaxis protein MotB
MLRQAEEAQAGRAGAEARCTALGRQLSEAERRIADEERRSRDRLAAAEEGHRRALQAEADLRGEAERKARDTDERLQASLVELKKSRHEETKAATALRDAEAHNARRAAALETRLRDVLQERNQLSELVEAEVKRRGRLKAFAALCLVAATVGVIFAVLALWRARTPADAGAEAPATPAAPAGRPAARPRPPSRPDAGGSLPMLRETGGARIEYQRDGCRVVFDRGAFSTQTAVAESARQVMRQLAPQIKPHLQTFILQIEGHTDNTPVGSGSRFGSNTELARARAQAFADFLRREHGFPAEKMRPVAAAGGPPHPNNDDAGRARNRTVVLKLVRHAGP